MVLEKKALSYIVKGSLPFWGAMLIKPLIYAVLIISDSFPVLENLSWGNNVKYAQDLASGKFSFKNPTEFEFWIINTE